MQELSFRHLIEAGQIGERIFKNFLFSQKNTESQLLKKFLLMEIAADLFLLHFSLKQVQGQDFLLKLPC